MLLLVKLVCFTPTVDPAVSVGDVAHLLLFASYTLEFLWVLVPCLQGGLKMFFLSQIWVTFKANDSNVLLLPAAIKHSWPPERCL